MSTGIGSVSHCHYYLLVASLLVPVLAAQTTANKSSIGGVVTDSSSAVIPGARVTVNNEATGLSRGAVTNSAGAYQFTALDPGTYSLKVESGSAGASVRSITLSIGGATRVNVRLSVKENLQSIDLSESSASTTEAGAAELLNEEVINNLAVNGRRFQDFAQLAPATEALTQTRGQLSFSGQRGIYSNVMVEGSDYNEPFLGGIRGGERSSYAFTIPQSAIQEFQVVESGYGVEYGRSSGGMLNVLTRSGTNAWRGTAFYQIRPHSLSASDPYGLPSHENQHQFGGSFGGPVQRDKLFFFLASEWQIASFPQTVRFPGLDSLSGQVTPDIAPAYNYFRSLEGSFHQTNNIGSAFGRLDYQFSGANRLAARFNHSQNRAKNAMLPDFTPESQINRALSANGNLLDYTDSASGQLTTIFPGVVNDVRLEYTRERQPGTANAASPFVSAGPIGVFGTDPSLPASLNDYRFQFSDAVSFMKGRHNLSAGADYSFISAHSLAGANQYGSFVINGSDVRSILQILSGVSGNRFDDPSVSYLRQVGDLKLGANAHQAAVFAQDDWRLSPAFAVNFGMRWEGQINPSPKTDNAFLVDNVRNFNFPLGRVDPTLIRSQMNQWAPRAGFVWNPTGRGDTMLRASGGLFYAQTPLASYAGPINNFSSTPGDLTLQIASMGAETVYRQFLAGGFNLNAGSLANLPVFTVPDVWINVAGKPNPFAQANVITTSGNNFRNPRAAQLSLIVQHEFSGGLVIDYQLNHLNTVHLERNVDFNTPVPFVQPGDLSLRPFFGLESGTPRPNPNLGAVLVRDASARSSYTGNTLRVRYRAKSVQLAAHYTLSYNKSDDDNERQINSIAYQNPFNFTRDYNWSSLDSRHQVSGYALWQAPLGIELGATFQYRSGLPIDAITGADTSQLLTPNFGSRPLSSPGVYMLRNSFRNRDLRTIDFRVMKKVRIHETTAVEVYGDFFNLFNFDNVAFVPSIVYPDNPAFAYGPGILSNGTAAPVNPGFLSLRTASGGYAPVTTYQQGTPFEAQLGVRLTF
jgi:Carboxypeptidase regulatory-like domain